VAVEISYSDFSVEVTRECSGIHSTMAMLILSVMASYFYLRTAWRQGLITLRLRLFPRVDCSTVLLI